MAARLPPRGADGRFKKLVRRRNLDGYFAGGKFHPIRDSEDYDGHLLAKPEYEQDTYLREYAKYSRGEDTKLSKTAKRRRAAGRGSSDPAEKWRAKDAREEMMERFGRLRNPKTGRFVAAKKQSKKK